MDRDFEDELPEWLIKDGVCRAVDCLPECPAYDYGCRLRAESIAGDVLRDLQRAKEQTVEGLKAELDNAEKARQQGWNEANYFRGVVLNLANQSCRKLLLAHETTCPEEFTDRSKWCLACRARVALEERPNREHDERRYAVESVIMGVVRYHLPGFTHGSPMYEQAKDHIPWLIEEGFLTEGKDGRIWFFNRERVRQEIEKA